MVRRRSQFKCIKSRSCYSNTNTNMDARPKMRHHRHPLTPTSPAYDQASRAVVTTTLLCRSLSIQASVEDSGLQLKDILCWGRFDEEGAARRTMNNNQTKTI